MAIRGGDDEEEDVAGPEAERREEDAGRGPEAPEVPGHDTLVGIKEDDDGIEHPLQEAARWGSSSSAPVTSSATKGLPSLEEDHQAA